MKRKVFYFSMLLFATMVFIGCSTDYTDKETTYTFIYNAKDVSGVTVSALIYEYDKSGEIVGQQSLKCANGLTRVFTADSMAKKVKVKVTLKAGTKSGSYWLEEVFYLKNGKNIDIKILDSTTLVEEEP